MNGGKSMEQFRASALDAWIWSCEDLPKVLKFEWFIQITNTLNKQIISIPDIKSQRNKKLPESDFKRIKTTSLQTQCSFLYFSDVIHWFSITGGNSSYSYIMSFTKNATNNE